MKLETLVLNVVLCGKEGIIKLGVDGDVIYYFPAILANCHSFSRQPITPLAIIFIHKSIHLKTVGTQSYLVFSLHRPEETCMRSRNNALVVGEINC